MNEKEHNNKVKATHKALQKAFDDFVIACVDAVNVDAAATMVMIEIAGMMQKFTDSQLAALRMTYEEFKKEGK